MAEVPVDENTRPVIGEEIPTENTEGTPVDVELDPSEIKIEPPGTVIKLTLAEVNKYLVDVDDWSLLENDRKVIFVTLSIYSLSNRYHLELDNELHKIAISRYAAFLIGRIAEDGYVKYEKLEGGSVSYKDTETNLPPIVESLLLSTGSKLPTTRII